MRRTALRHNLALATMLLWIATIACHKWVPLQASPPVAQQVESVEKLRVSTADGRIIELSHDVELAADSLVGFIDDPGDEASSPRIAIAYDDIETIEARRSNTDATIGVVVGSTALIVGLIALASASTPGNRF